MHIAGRIDVDCVRVALLGDGAGWIWNAQVKAFSQGRQILDYYHWAEHVWKVADHLFGEGSLDAQEWAEATLVRLCLAEVKETIDDLQSLNPRSAQAREEVQKLITYLKNNAHRIDYLENLGTGYAIGSGVIESANKFISHTHMKRSGAWWVVPLLVCNLPYRMDSGIIGQGVQVQGGGNKHRKHTIKLILGDQSQVKL